MTDIKDMQLYPTPERIIRELAALGYPDGPVPAKQVAALDQLHYHGAAAVDVAIDTLKFGPQDRAL